ADGAPCPYAHSTAHFLDQLFNITGKVAPSVIALKRGDRNLVVYQFLCAFWLSVFWGAIIKHAIFNENIFAVDVRNRHHNTVSAALCGVTYRNNRIWFLIYRQFKIAVQFILREQKPLSLEWALLEF